ncbi:MAG: L-threonylcarbamoyladenylate synthase [Pseudomonadales bacterium]|nr:L-threonylcarbamoyladenylate synthase [Pseudomonadales bacterium]
MFKASAFKIQQAVRCLESGGLLAYPTESVYGLGCDPFNADAVDRLLALKHRDEAKGLILVAASREQVMALLPGLSTTQLDFLERSSLAEPLTGLLPDENQCIPPWIKGQHSRVALRISMHPLVQELCLLFGGALVSSSANVTGFAPAKTPLQVRQQLQSGLDYLLVGPLGGARNPSRIQNLCDNTVIRP